ncbi:MAG: hypothetical protein C4541_08745 [Candidatus Auribacter fodinae]|uniref:Peptidase MA-like domain-containing protein n=1 Tax=Candidatus Auribacter fodinae TaxID=2093366 RepID=A0A3A4R111_9BACT|nr:MAG: hypothetical protein C4541_08745 [Candidatus Auribacter fodinae]
MRRSFLYILTFFCFAAQTSCFPQELSFEEIKSDHFIIQYRCGTSFAKEVETAAEKYYDSITTDLELDRFSGFWTWDNRCTIILFESHDEYCAVTRQPDWSGGHVDYRSKRLYAFPWAENFLNSLLPHELTHIILREYIKDNPNVPLWIDEGLAQFQENIDRTEQDNAMRGILKDGAYIPLAEIQRIKSLIQVEDDRKISLFYLQSYYLIRFMVDSYGKQQFAEFIRQLRAGKTVEEALRFAYPSSIRTIALLEQKWCNSGE